MVNCHPGSQALSNHGLVLFHTLWLPRFLFSCARVKESTLRLLLEEGLSDFLSVKLGRFLLLASECLSPSFEYRYSVLVFAGTWNYWNILTEPKQFGGHILFICLLVKINKLKSPNFKILFNFRTVKLMSIIFIFF